MKHSIIYFFEKVAFGVCEWWGRKLGIEPAKMRLYFIYCACATLGSFLLPYLLMAMVLKIRNYFRPKRRSVWDI